MDLQKAFDSADREPLWKVFARAGIRAKRTDSIRQFHGEVRARLYRRQRAIGLVHGHAGRETGVPLTFNVSFAAPLEVNVCHTIQRGRCLLCRTWWG